MNPLKEYYIRKEEVARRLGIKPRGVECLVTRGIIPCIKIKGPNGKVGMIRFRWPAVEKALEKYAHNHE